MLFESALLSTWIWSCHFYHVYNSLPSWHLSRPPGLPIWYTISPLFSLRAKRSRKFQIVPLELTKEEEFYPLSHSSLIPGRFCPRSRTYWSQNQLRYCRQDNSQIKDLEAPSQRENLARNRASPFSSSQECSSILQTLRGRGQHLHHAGELLPEVAGSRPEGEGDGDRTGDPLLHGRPVPGGRVHPQSEHHP